MNGPEQSGPDPELLDTIHGIAPILKEKAQRAGGEFSETLIINPDGSIKLPIKKEDGEVSLFGHLANDSAEDLIQLAFQIQQQFPEIHFTFEKDPHGEWLKYSVTESGEK
jgi:hypothetical protein